VTPAAALAQGEKEGAQESAPSKPAEGESRPARGAARQPRRQVPAGAPVAIEGVRIIRPGEPDIEKGVILVRGHKIVGVGAKLAIPENARRIDGTGAVATAGWIDARGTTPLDAESANDGAPNAERRATDGIDFVDPYGRVADALRNGVVATYVTAGRGLYAGTGALIRMRPNERDLEKLEVDDAAAAAIVGGSSRGYPTIARLNDWTGLRRQLREAQKYREALDQYQEDLAKYLEEKKKGAKTASRPAESRESAEPAPGQRPPVQNPRGRRPPRTPEEAEYLALARALGFSPVAEGRDGAFILDDSAPDPAKLGSEEVICSCGSPGPHEHHPPGSDVPQYYFQEPAKPAEKTVDRPKKPDFNPSMDALVKILRHEMPARFEARRADEIRAAIALAKEFHLRAVIEGGDEAGLLLDEIADAKIPVVLAPVRDVREPEGWERTAALAAELAKHKIPFAIGTGRGHFSTMWLRAQVAMAIAGGLPRDAALAAVTSGAAAILGVDTEMGALAPGREANIVLFDGDPFDPTTPVRMAMVDGDVLYQR
jgi:imidazolonepropionase-like amidohydrolase